MAFISQAIISKVMPSMALTSAISALRHDTATADFTLVCEFKEWRLHSFILTTRSPFFKAAISNNTLEKQEKRIDIRDLDSEAMQEVINYMYGAPVEKSHYKDLLNILEASVRFQMDDLKKHVVDMLKQSITRENVVEIGHFSELYNIDQLLQYCVDFIVKNDIEVDVEDEGVTKFAASILTSVQKAYKKTKKDLKDCKDEMRNEEFFKIKVVGEDGKELNFNLQKHIKMERVMKKYCAKFGVCNLSRAFFYNGRRIVKNETPEDLNIKNEDVIEARTCAQ